MNKYFGWAILVLCITHVFSAQATEPMQIEPVEEATYSVGSTNMEVASEYVDIGDEAMHEYLLGRTTDPNHPKYVTDILKYPDSAWIVDVTVPDEFPLYGPASGKTLPVLTFLTYPSRKSKQSNTYLFPYHNSRYGVFENMLAAGETPEIADPGKRYPLTILAHGSAAHGIYDVKHAHTLASQGYVVAVIFYGDDRTASANSPNHHVGFLRSLLTKSVLDSIIESKKFGEHIDVDNIGISGHSFGGFTALAMAGGDIQGNPASVRDKRIKASVVAAPWVGGNDNGRDTFAFGTNNLGLSNITTPTLCLFGTKDEATLASFILPATKQFAGPTFVVELIDQPHIFEPGSWEDRNNWELLFFSAYLKNNHKSLDALKAGRSMKGGNQDIQRFDYQRATGKPGRSRH